MSKETETNEFAEISKLVDNIILQYREVRKDCDIPNNGWHSRTIERIAQPFLKGHFTLAVVGKVSSGKSTFINALLGCKGLLPTGHDQTTCGVTYIEYGEIPEVAITFGDGHKEFIKGDISGKIKPYVAIPENYHSLPVNNIDDMIMGEYDYKNIWEVHKQLEDETFCPPIDKTLLKDYVEHRSKKCIVKDVHIKYPFNEALKGWRVIDTPGVGAIGGIETCTRQLLAMQKADGSREVDAIFFLQNGSQTLDQTDTKKFVKEQLDNLSESDKSRLFFVLTHSSSSDFILHKASKIDFIKQNYGDKIKVLTYADSLLYTFLAYIDESNLSLDEYDDFDQPVEWADDEWNAIMGILDQAKRHIKKTHDSFNHDTMLRTVKEWSHFEELKNEINAFAKLEKEKTLRRLLNLVATDYRGFYQQLEKDKQLVDGDLTSINEEIRKVERNRQDYNVLARKADKLISGDRIKLEFDFVGEKLLAFENLTSIDSVRTSVTDLFDLVQKREKKVCEEIIQQFSVFCKDASPSDITLESIDFTAIERDATSKSTETYVIEPERVITHTSDPDERIPAKYGTRTNNATKLKEFKALALKRARRQKDKLLPQIKEKADNMRNQIFEELDLKNKEELARLEGLKSQLTDKEAYKVKNDVFIAKTRAASEELIKQAQDYGFEF